MENYKYNSIADAINKGIKKTKIKKTELAISFSYSNKKLKDNKEIKFIQWNINAIKTCPFSTELCRSLCYARKAEVQYPNVRNRRGIHTNLCNQIDFVSIMIEQISYELKHTKKRIYFRIHESGDFMSFSYLEKWYQITNEFKGQNIVFMAYTKSLPFVKELFEKYGKENVNIKFMSSIWADTKKKMIDLTNYLDLKIYTSLSEEDLKKAVNYELCSCSAGSKENKTCATCKKCYEGTSNISIQWH